MFYYGAPQIPGLYPSMDAVLHRLQSLSPAAHLLNLTLEKAPAKTLPTNSNAADPNQLADYSEARGLVSMPVPVPALPAFANDGLWLRAYCRPRAAVRELPEVGSRPGGRPKARDYGGILVAAPHFHERLSD